MPMALRVLNPKSLILKYRPSWWWITAALFLKQFVKETPWAHRHCRYSLVEKENGYNSPVLAHTAFTLW